MKNYSRLLLSAPHNYKTAKKNFLNTFFNDIKSYPLQKLLTEENFIFKSWFLYLAPIN